MLARRYRLTSSEDFARVHAAGQSWADRMLVLCIRANGLPISRFGFSVSRRIGKAVVRNRVKRLLREAIRLRRDTITEGWDVLLIARKGVLEADYQEIEQALARLLVRAQLSGDHSLGEPEQ